MTLAQEKFFINDQGQQWKKNIDDIWRKVQPKPDFDWSRIEERKMRSGMEVRQFTNLSLQTKIEYGSVEDEILELVALTTLKEDFLKRNGLL